MRMSKLNLGFRKLLLHYCIMWLSKYLADPASCAVQPAVRKGVPVCFHKSDPER